MTQQVGIKLGREEIADRPATRGPSVIAVVSPGRASAESGALLNVDFSAPAEVWSSESVNRRLLGLVDVVGVLAALVLVAGRLSAAATWIAAVATIPLVLVVFKFAGLYNRDELGLRHSTLDEVPALLQVTGLVALAITIVQGGLVSGGLSGLGTGVVWVAAFLAVFAGRTLARTIARRLVSDERCLVIGDAQHVDRIGSRIVSSGARATIVDCLAFRREDIFGARAAQTIRSVVRDLRVHRIIIAPDATDGEMTLELIRTAKAVGVRVSLLPGPLEVIGSRLAFDHVGGMTMLGVPRFGLCRSDGLLKRTLDIVGGTIGLVLIGPVIGAIALAIKLDSRGPVFFRQVRVGRDGHHFSILKFRTMGVDAEARKEELRSLSIAGPGLFKIADDPRVTRIGRLLRGSSLDELPQLFNVLRGEMSLVGPRPLVVEEDAQVRGLDRSRLRLKPGMTGPWQLLEERVPLQEMVGIDYFYASSWSLWLDLKIMLRTVTHVLRRGNV